MALAALSRREARHQRLRFDEELPGAPQPSRRVRAQRLEEAPLAQGDGGFEHFRGGAAEHAPVGGVVHPGKQRLPRVVPELGGFDAQEKERLQSLKLPYKDLVLKWL